MKTNFFERVTALKISGNLLLTINQDANGLLTVSAVISKAGNLPPMLFKGSPEQLDEAFFEKIADPVKQTNGLVTNLDAYQKELDKAKKQGKDKAPAAKNAAADDTEDIDDEDTNNLFTPQPDDKQAKAEKKKRFDEQLLKVKTLAQQMKYAEALAQLPDPAEYPEQAELIDAKRQEVQKGKDIYDRLQEQFND